MVYLVGFTVEIYHEARSYKRQTINPYPANVEKMVS